MPRLSTLPATALLALAATAGCSHSMDASEIKRNPHPKDAYAITVTVEGAPRPFDSIKVLMHSEIENRDCAPRDLLSGVHQIPSADPEFTFRRTGESYTGTVYFDALLDGNYFWLGKCHWQPNMLNVELRIGKQVYVASISPADITAHRTVKTYFLKEQFGHAEAELEFEPSLPKTYENLAAEHPQQYFSIELAAREHGA